MHVVGCYYRCRYTRICRFGSRRLIICGLTYEKSIMTFPYRNWWLWMDYNLQPLQPLCCLTSLSPKIPLSTLPYNSWFCSSSVSCDQQSLSPYSHGRAELPDRTWLGQDTDRSTRSRNINASCSEVILGYVMCDSPSDTSHATLAWWSRYFL